MDYRQILGGEASQMCITILRKIFRNFRELKKIYAHSRVQLSDYYLQQELSYFSHFS